MKRERVQKTVSPNRKSSARLHFIFDQRSRRAAISRTTPAPIDEGCAANFLGENRGRTGGFAQSRTDGTLIPQRVCESGGQTDVHPEVLRDVGGRRPGSLPEIVFDCLPRAQLRPRPDLRKRGHRRPPELALDYDKGGGHGVLLAR